MYIELKFEKRCNYSGEEVATSNLQYPKIAIHTLPPDDCFREINFTKIFAKLISRKTE